LLVPVTEKLYVPVTVGIPVIVPVELFNTSPFGKAPIPANVVAPKVAVTLSVNEN
jgi:hypothetical protein